MLISSWNVNSVRARIENIKSYLLKYKPDILMMQEIKTEDINFPYDDFSSMDYESHVFGQKSYNGVAIVSRGKLKNVKTDLIKDKLKQSRIISAELEHKKKNIQLCIDAEEDKRFILSLKIFKKLIEAKELSNWNGLGLALQAYQKFQLTRTWNHQYLILEISFIFFLF